MTTKGSYLLDDYEEYTGMRFEDAPWYVDKGKRKPTRDELLRADIAQNRQTYIEQLGKRDGKHCRICGSLDDLTIDHKRAIIKGGDNDLENLQFLCRSCNSRKGTR